MFKSIIWKIIAIGVLAVLLLIPLSMVSGLVSERKAYRQTAINSIVDGAAGNQLVNGPVWVLPYRQKFKEVIDEKAGTTREVWRNFTVQRLPDDLHITGKLRTYPRQRGIYVTQLYTADLTLKGRFQLPARDSISPGAIIEWGEPYLSVGIQDVRGIKSSPALQWGEEKTPFQPGAKMKVLGNGIHAALPPQVEAKPVDFSFVLALEGMDELSFAPLGRDTEVTLDSAWLHPSFNGRFLPEKRDITANGFNAHWQTSWFATNLNEKFETCMQGDCSEFSQAQLGVRLMEPVDVYVQTDRAVKYGFLFVFLTFCVFFLTELLRRVAIHPVQYGLVGLSLAVFFLLVLSLAEQLSFPLAYLLASIACVLQNGFYAGHALGSKKRAAGFVVLLSGLYGLLYLLLCSEDHALLLGSLLLFGVLTGVMVLTRKLNWYGLERVPVGTGDVAGNRI